MKYEPKNIEKKWQQYWEEKGINKNYSREKKFYALDMFPYPSGVGLHVGHPKGYIATDVVSRFKMLNGFSVLHPMGWDAFGLPAENYAIKNKSNPNVFTAKSIATYKKQLEMFGFTYDWDREINTTDPEYYKWTQWIFLKLFEKGLAYESNAPINWCPSCKTGLSNEDLENGKCERCGSDVEQKPMRQWVLKMTEYADRLLYDLDSQDLDWEDMIVQQQKNWIGRSEGVQFEIKIKDSEEKIEVYTTRIDTVFGITYAVVAPEHEIIEKIKEKISNYSEVEKYIEDANKKTNLERTELQKEKTGVKLEGVKVVNPFTKEVIPLFVADYVLGGYGTGAVMAVPAHDERDFEFAFKQGLDVIEVVLGGIISEKAFTEDGILINSDKYDGLTSEQAREKMADWLEKEGIGKRKVNYKMRDWVYSRQRYWGEPIPIIHCEKCGAVGVPEEQLPVTLPDVENYEPTGTGESPLANIHEWVNTTCPKCGGSAKRETNTMPQWGGSSWYYLRYIDPKNDKELVSKELEKEWMPVDLYVGGAEHATRHLLYARFWHKFLYDIGVVSTTEPFKKLVHVGLIMAEDGRKMSKRWNNVVNPDDVIAEFGADSMRLYEMFMGPFSQSVAWSTAGVKGVRKFLDKVWKLQGRIMNHESGIKNKKIDSLVHKTIKKVGEDIENFRFNTAISAMMILVNAMEKESQLSVTSYELLITILSPFAPHIAEEIWQEKLGNKQSIFLASWPQFDADLARDEEMEIVVQVNGKVRERLMVAADVTEDEIKETALESEKVKVFTEGKEIKKVIFVPGKLLNIVI
ncbi:MAG: Leucine-tRNA ligase [Candidatus Moranbacteria bacterium GW2011_GWC2_37_8]|nr:MAG: Leucine-tRNA ligase [Candidatus Moranbacteria bacterium GW2011_GWC2_37_8]KKQ63345.1 MAG: Leucine-tRNA ligase [Parcubacteria group bacterium GW2011_GWC1_38_22]